MTLTPPVVDAAGDRVVLVTGADKAPAIANWLEGPRSPLPIERVPTTRTTVVLDAAAASQLTTATHTA
jgi:6-phosphogluconolactonase/glucosamine-6-phosphate isomerase/deaminase